MTPGRFDIEVPRNGSDFRLFQLFAVDGAGVESAIDVTGFSFSADARDVFGGSVIATAAVTIDTAASGKISVKWLGSQFDAFGNTQAAAVAAYDLKMIDTGGLATVPVRGLIFITPEATA